MPFLSPSPSLPRQSEASQSCFLSPAISSAWCMISRAFAAASRGSMLPIASFALEVAGQRGEECRQWGKLDHRICQIPNQPQLYTTIISQKNKSKNSDPLRYIIHRTGDQLTFGGDLSSQLLPCLEGTVDGRLMFLHKWFYQPVVDDH